MRLVEIEIANFRSIGELTFPFDDGVFALVGENGAGKSSLLMAVDVALYGRRSLTPLIRWGHDEMRLALTFEHGGNRYRVRRELKRGGNAKLNLEVMVDGEWETRNRGTAADTQAYLTNLTGVTHDVFRAACFLAQHESDSFAGALPADRKRKFAEGLNLGGIQKGSEAAGKDRLAVEKQLAVVTATVDGLAERAAQADALTTEAGDLRLLVDVAEAGIAEHTAAAETHALRAAELDRADSAWKVARANAAAARTAEGAHAALALRTVAAKGELAAVREELEAIGVYVPADELEKQERILTAAHEAYRHAVLEHNAALIRRNEIDGRRQRLTVEAADLLIKAGQTRQLIDGSAHCETCGQTLGAEAARVAADTYAARADDLKQQAAAVATEADAVIVPDVPGEEPDGQEITDIRRRIEDARRYAAREIEVRTRIAGLERTIAETDTDEYRDTARRLSFELTEAEHALKAITQPEPGAADHARAAALQAKAQADAHAQRGRSARERLAVVTVHLEQAQTALVEHAAATAERDRLHHEIDVLATIEKALGRDGLPAWIVEKKIPEFEAVTNDYLRKLGSTPSRIEFRNERETKDGRKSEALDIICHSDDGEAPIEDFSGGEQYRAHLGLAFGMRSVVAAAGGANLRYLALDEPEGLDAKGKEALAGILRDIVANGVDTALLTSHDPGLRDSFERSVLVERGTGGSRVVA